MLQMNLNIVRFGLPKGRVALLGQGPILQNKKGCGGARQPLQTFLRVKTNQGKLCIILMGIYGRFRISLNNCELQNFAIL